MLPPPAALDQTVAVFRLEDVVLVDVVRFVLVPNCPLLLSPSSWPALCGLALAPKDVSARLGPVARRQARDVSVRTNDGTTA